MTKTSMQIDVPDAMHDALFYAPRPIGQWLIDNGLTYTYCGSSMSGDGTTDGKSNIQRHYIVRLKSVDDSTAFAIQFPQCKVHLFER